MAVLPFVNMSGEAENEYFSDGLSEEILNTLAQVPGSDGPGDVAGEFADVLALDGMEYEAAIARMTPAQRERFLRA